MLSNKSIDIKKHIIKDTLRKDIPIQDVRDEWEQYALTLPLPKGTQLTKLCVADVPCLKVDNNHSSKDKLIMYVHGGGLTEGSSNTHREFAARLTDEISIPVLLIDYRLAPEHPYPEALNDVISVYIELLSMGYSNKNIYFGGDSSGAGLALAAVLNIKEHSYEMPGKVFFISGVFDMTLSGESMLTRSEIDPFTSKDVLEHCIELYVSNYNLNSPYISPLFAELSGLPPILILVGDHDILLSDSIRLADEILQKKGSIILTVYDSMWHCWPMYQELPEAQKAIKEIENFLL